MNYTAIVYYGNVHESDSDGREFDSLDEAKAWVHSECQWEDTLRGIVIDTFGTCYRENGFFA